METGFIRRVAGPMRVAVCHWPMGQPKAIEAFPKVGQEARANFRDPPLLFAVDLGVSDGPPLSPVPDRRDLTKVHFLAFVIQHSASGSAAIIL